MGVGSSSSKNDQSHSSGGRNPKKITGHDRYHNPIEDGSPMISTSESKVEWPSDLCESMVDESPIGVPVDDKMDQSVTPKFPNENPRTKAPKSDVFSVEELCGRYEFVRYLGRGSYGHVCEARHVRTGERVAIKKIVNVFENSQEAKRILREVRILRELADFEYISDVKDILPPKDLDNFQDLSIVFEFVDTDLSKIIDWTDQFFSVQHVQYFLWQLLVGLKYIHSSNIVHRDLKPANILINEDCSLRICDFGLSRGLKKNHHHSRKATPHNLKSIGSMNRPSFNRPLTRHVVTRYYRAPEVLLRANYSTPVDMWSVGCISAELLNMIKENCSTRKMRKPLFPGLYSTFSPPHDPYDHKPSKDQLNTIFSVTGTPTVEEISKLEVNERTKKYLKTLKPKKTIAYEKRFPSTKDVTFIWQFKNNSQWESFSSKESKQLEEAYQEHYIEKQDHELIEVLHENKTGTIDFHKMTLTLDGQKLKITRKNSAIDFLNGLLQFDASKRLTVDQALSHPFLMSYHDESVEKAHAAVEFEFEDVDLTSKDIRRLLIHEVFHHNMHLIDEYPEYASDFHIPPKEQK